METKSIDLKRRRAELFLAYHQELDDTSLVILTILSDQQKKVFEEQNKKIDKAVDKINNTQRSLEVSRDNPIQQAFWFGMGKFGFALVLSIILSATIYICYLYSNREEKYNEAVFNWYKTYYEKSKNNYTKKAWEQYLKTNPFPQ
jgi:trehalose-6-phosphate synthase